MFLGIIAVLSNPAYGTRNFNALGYACSNPTDIKVYDAEAWCQSDPELPERKTVKIAKLVVNEELKSFNCRITSHSKSYFCLLFSYSKPILSVEGEETMIVEKWQTLAGLSHHKPLKVRK